MNLPPTPNQKLYKMNSIVLNKAYHPPTSAMASLSWTAVGILLFLTTLAAHLIRRIASTAHQKHLKLPPGPTPWPIIGNLDLIGSLPHRTFDKLSKKYGEIMLVKFGHHPVVVASSPEMAKEFLKTHDQTFSSRPATAAGKYTAYNYKNMTWAPYGSYWRQARKIYLNELFSSKQLDSYEYIRVDERRAFLSRLYGLSGQEIVMRKHLTQFTLTNISRMALGDKYFSESEYEFGSQGSSSAIVKLKDLQVMLEEWFWLNGVFNIGDWIPWLGFLDLQGHVKKMKILSEKLNKFHSYVIGTHMDRMKKEEKKGFVPKDIVDVILQLAEDPNLDVKLTGDCVKGLIQDPIAGGTDTSATTMEWAISELLKSPRTMKKAAEELDRVIGRDRWAEEKDMSQLPYINAIVKETMRLHPVSTMLAPHFSTGDCKVSGYHIPKGTTVFINVWSIGRDPKYWEEPEKFMPERFLQSDIDVKGQHFELLPFGSGRRMCPGYNLGLKLIGSIIANLLHGFDLMLPENMKPEDVGMEEEYGLTTHRAYPIVAVLEPRLSTHMY